ncbi:MAG: NAD(P)/FAD-dependent oxidoreductase, partial [Clostridia bacterium]|nr:NAD(P)/FAD-dependent oxidoreductase [Clostridia bacterium]
LGGAGNKQFGTMARSLLPTSMIPPVASLAGIPLDLKCNTVTREMRRNLLRTLKDFPISVAGFRPIEEAIVTSGGVSVKELSPRTMESKKVSGLFFAGEVIDVDGYTGGFNLQIAWSTGIAAARGAASRAPAPAEPPV